jgi:hypothetical protein
MPRLTTIRRTTRRASRRTGAPVGRKPERLLAKLEPLIESNKADELMVTAMIFDHVPSKHSYELLAKALAQMLKSARRTTFSAFRMVQ